MLSQWFFRPDYLHNAAVLSHIPDQHNDVHICSLQQLFSISEGKDWEINPFPSSIFFQRRRKKIYLPVFSKSPKEERDATSCVLPYT